MALTREFKGTVRARAQRDPNFRLALIEEAIEKLIDGDLDGGRSILSNYINATIGYPALAKLIGKMAVGAFSATTSTRRSAILRSPN
jgi:hypothetical protein